MSHAAAIQFYDYDPGPSDLLNDVLTGLAGRPKSIPPKYFYDRRGSELFDAICEVPEYYVTRIEAALLQCHAAEIARLAGPNCTLVELGSGASKKVRLLLEALRPATYLGVDISRDFLFHSTLRLAADYPWLDVHAACADFSQVLALSDHHSASTGKLAFFPGSSIGNFEPTEAQTFLARLSRVLEPDGALLVGVDLKKDTHALDAAYNDAAGVTGEFNLNLLHRINRELGSRIEPEQFAHRAFYNEAHGRVEMHLVSRRDQLISIAGQQFSLATGETIHTENSYKYTVEEFQALAEQAGYRRERVWTDTRECFSLHLLRLAAA